MSGVPLFSVVIPVFNKWGLTEACLRSLREHACGCDFEVIVVDNGSSDETAGALGALGEALFGPRFIRIRFEENRNFGPACNAGARAASAALLFFLNNDTLLTPGWAPPLLEALEADASLGGVGPLLLYEDDTVQHLGVVFSLFGVEHLYAHFPAEHPVVRKKRYFQAITAAALMMPQAYFLRHGGFYEMFRNGFEDVDLCLHLAREGKRFTCVSDATIYHLESRTVGRKDSEAHNSGILTERCTGLFRPDKHAHGLRDGFRVFINDRFEIGLRLKEEAEAALDQEAAGQTLDVWRQLCRAHPYWVRGRECLASVLEKSGYGREALACRAEAADILSMADSSKEWMLAAARLGNAEALAAATADMRKLAGRRQDAALCRKLLRMAAGFQDRGLEMLYEEKLREISP